MSTAELKIDLINKITKIKEDWIIKEIKKLLEFETDTTIFSLSTKQKKRIIEAQNDNTLTEKQANSEIEKWLNEK
ncbi:MAG: hypothetical protein H6604_03260 [Flavobacteriales bacterium]|nr:hypothetical protein [Flavobacteriales bacterium]